MTYFNEFGQARLGWNVGTPSGGGGGSTIDTDAQAFITAASITDSTQQSAINTLVTQLKTYGIWTKMKALYPFVGGTASSHKWNLKDPRDLDAAYRLVFNGGWTHSSTGALPNGTTAYANTNLNPYVVFGNNQATLPVDSTHSLVHVSKYSRTNSITTAIKYDGVYSGAGNFERPMMLGWDSNNRPNGLSAINGGVYSGSYAFVTLGNRSDGYFIINRDGFTSLKSFRNNTLISTNTTDIRSYNGGLQNNVNPNQVFFIGARNDSYDYNLRPFAYNNFETAFQSIGYSLTDAEAANFYTAVQTFQTTLGRQVGVPIVADSDAQAFLNAAVITDTTQASAINTLVTSLKSANIWTKMKAIYPFVGGTATTHKFNLKDPRDLDAAYRLVFNGGWTHGSTGALPNGTTAYADTKLNPSTAISNVSSSHFSLYSNVNKYPTANGSGKANGGYTTATSTPVMQIAFYRQSNGQPSYYFNLGSPASFLNVSSPTTAAFWLTTRTSSNMLKYIQNSSVINTDTTSITTGLPNINIYLGARNGNGTGDLYNDMPHQFSSIGDGLTDAEATAFYNAVQAYQTTLGRQI